MRRVVEPLLSGAEAAESIPPDDLQYVRDLGLITRSGPVAIANPIYREVIPRDLTWTTQEMSIHHDPAWYVDGDGALRVGELLAAFQEFFREHSEHWVERFQTRTPTGSFVSGYPPSLQAHFSLDKAELCESDHDGVACADVLLRTSHRPRGSSVRAGPRVGSTFHGMGECDGRTESRTAVHPDVAARLSSCWSSTCKLRSTQRLTTGRDSASRLVNHVAGAATWTLWDRRPRATAKPAEHRSSPGQRPHLMAAGRHRRNSSHA